MVVAHGEYVLRSNQLQYLSGIVGRNINVIEEIVRDTSHQDRIELKRALRQQMHDPSRYAIIMLYEAYEKARHHSSFGSYLRDV
jgi:hypothetical protein